MKYEKHIFICTNEKDGKKCCGEERGMELVKKFKDELKDRGLNKTMRAQRAGCFDVCKDGPAVVVYPEGIFYGHVKPKDVTRIIEEHLINNRPVSDLQLED